MAATQETLVLEMAHEQPLSGASGSGCVLFCYAKNGSVKCLPFGGDHNSLLNAGWKHTATIDAAIWIERLMAGHPDDAVGMMDELNFGPNQ